MLFQNIAERFIAPDLNTVVDQIAADLRVGKLKRDLPSRNRTRDALDLLRVLPESVKKRLSGSAKRPPYCAHAATAVSDSPDFEHLCDLWKTGNHYFSPALTREQKSAAIEMFGPQEVRAWRSWLAAEFRARSFCYGTRGIFLRRFFLAECVRYRIVLNSDHQAPIHWQDITALMIRSRALVPSLYHRSGGTDYPSFCFSGGGARPEWR
jgi:hypothetical protein